MKNILLSLAVASVVAMPLTTQAAGPIDGNIYGKVNISIVSSDYDNGAGSSDELKLNSNASRFGFKGKTELREGLYAIYKLEYETFVDDGDKSGNTFSQRNIVGGLSGSFGTLWAGKHDSPTKLSQKKIDLFNDLEGDIKHTFEGENRVNNIVAYTTPNMSGLSVTIAGVFGEGDSGSKVGEAGDDNDSVDGASVSINYENEGLYLALAADQDIDGQDLVRAVAQWKVDALQLGLMYQKSESNIDSDIKDEDGWFISAAYKIDKVKLKAQYGRIEDDADGDEEETLSIGADYKLGKKTKLYAFYTQNTDEDGGSSDEEEDKYVGVGMEHKF